MASPWRLALGGMLLAASLTWLASAVRPALTGGAPPGSPSLHLLQTLPVEPPGRGPCLLLLYAEEVRGAQPLRSHLYLHDPRSGPELRRLSLPASYNFWQIHAGDVTGDGRQEIGLCTFSRTVHDPELRRRFFIYGWTEQGDLRPLWQGSRLCRPYLSVLLTDVTGDNRAELVSLEITPEGRRLLVAYAWNQFGFWGIADSASWRDLSLLETGLSPEGRSGIRLLVTEDSGETREAGLELREGAWKEFPLPRGEQRE